MKVTPGVQISSGLPEELLHLLAVNLAIQGMQQDRIPESEFQRKSAGVRGSFQFDVRKDGGIHVAFIRDEGEAGLPKTYLLFGASAFEKFMNTLGCPLSPQQIRAAEQKQPIQGFAANLSANDYERFFG
jgi:hypothetical protein